MAVLAVVFLTLAFEGLVFGGELASQSFPQPIDSGTACSGTGLDLIANCVFAFFEGVLNVFRVIFGVVAFIWNLITFNVPGAPDYVRYPVGGIIVVGLVWSIAGLIRGN